MMKSHMKIEISSKVFFQHLIVTFLITCICWMPCVILSLFQITMKEYFWIYTPWFLGGLSPTIASFIVLRINQVLKGFFDWLKHVFDFKHMIWGIPFSNYPSYYSSRLDVFVIWI